MENEKKIGRKPKQEPPKAQFNNSFKDILRNLMLEKNITQLELSENTSFSRQTIGKWSKGGTVPDIYALQELADYFNVSTDYLLGRTKEKTTNEDIQKTIETTGLSEKAINSIVLYKEWSKEDIDKSFDLFNSENKYTSYCLKALDALLSRNSFRLTLGNVGELISKLEDLQREQTNLFNPSIREQAEIQNYRINATKYKSYSNFIKCLESIEKEYKDNIKTIIQEKKEILRQQKEKDGETE